MAFSAYVDSFVLSTSTGAQTISPGGLTFSPQGGLFIGNSLSSDGFDTSVGAVQAIGAAHSASDQRYQAFESEDASASADVGAVAQANGVITGLVANNVVDYVADLTSFNPSAPRGFTLNVSNAPGTSPGPAVNYILLGDDVTGVETFVFTLGSVGSGNRSLSSLSGMPSCVIFFTEAALTAVDTFGPATSNGSSMLGWMCADGTQGVSGTRHTDATAAGDTARWQHPSRCIDLRTVSSNLVSAAFVSMDGKGFTVNATVTVANIRVYGVAIYGGTWTAGAFTANNGGQSSVTTTGVVPKLLLLQSVDRTPNTTTQTNGNRGLGATDATRRWTVAYGDTDAADPTAAVSYLNRTKLLANVTPAGTLDELFDIVTFDAQGFTYDHSTVTTQAEVLYLVGGDVFGAMGVTPHTGRLSLLGVS